jgi:tetratricopeptide (TPR) repeat protein
MTIKLMSVSFRATSKGLCSGAAILLAAIAATAPLHAQQAPAETPQRHSANQTAEPAKDAGKNSATPAPQTPDRAAAYYHFALAHMYEDMATNYGQPEYASKAIEEYKLALDADPTSQFLNGGLADLYLRTGRIRDAVEAAQATLKTDPNNLQAHKLLGRVYLQSLGNMQGNGASGQVLQLAIAEYTKIVQLEPDDIESRLLLGQLYSLNHDTKSAADQFQAAQKIDPNSEEVVLNLARLYADSGNTQRAVTVLTAVPEEDRTPKMNYALGVSYDQLKDTKHAIDAYSKALDEEPDNLDAERGLAEALLTDGQLDEALKHFQNIAAADPQDAQTYLRISEIQRRQGHFDQALTTLKKAKSLASDSLEINYNEALIDDSLGHYDDAVQILEGLVSQTARTDGQYSDEDKNNRAIFLDRLANIYREQVKPDQAIATYQKMIDLGGDDYAERGYQGQVDTYREVHQYDKATAVAQKAAQAMPKDKAIQLMVALQLSDGANPDQGIKLAQDQLNGSPGDRDAEMTLAQIYTRLRRWKDAEDELDKAEVLSTKPEERIYVYFLQGALAERQKHYDSAEEAFRKVLTIDPNNAETLNYLGYMLADRGVRLDEALSMVQKAVSAEPQNGFYLDSLGWVYFKMGQYTLSEVNLNKALERMSTDPTVHDHMGELYEKTGRLKQAEAQWEQSLKEYAVTTPADADPIDVSKVQKKLESARVRLAKGNEASTGSLAK